MKRRQGARRQDKDSSSQCNYPVSLLHRLPTKFRRLPGAVINPQAAKKCTLEHHALPSFSSTSTFQAMPMKPLMAAYAILLLARTTAQLPNLMGRPEHEMTAWPIQGALAGIGILCAGAGCQAWRTWIAQAVFIGSWSGHPSALLRFKGHWPV